MSEHDQQAAVVQYCDLMAIPCFAIPNGGKRSKSEAARFKAEGVRAGVPDLFIPVARGGYHGFFLEMKDVNGRPPRPNQREWLNRLDAQGYCTAWAAGADTAIKQIQRYMSL